MAKSEKQFDLDERLIDFAVRALRVADVLPATAAGNHIRGQLVRCATSPAANYAEAQSAESQADFIHKLKIVLRELRETKVWLRIISRGSLIKPASKLERMLDENDELISIFVASVKTALRRKR